MEGNPFDLIPKDEDTLTLGRKHIKFGRFRILEENWIWEGLSGCSLVVPLIDIVDSPEQEVINMFACAYPLGENYTTKKTDDFLFINFNFNAS